MEKKKLIIHRRDGINVEPVGRGLEERQCGRP